MALQKGWILISRSGTVGNCAFASRLHAQKLASEDVIRLVPDYILRAGVIYAYLASKYGHSLLTQGVFGAVIQHIEPAFIASLPIPMFPESFQAEVDDLIQESARLREEANDKLEEAIEYFNEHYPIKDGIQQYFYKKVSELKNGFAAYNNNLEVDDYIRSYSANSFIVGDEADECFAPPMFKHIYLSKDNGYPFMTGSELQRFNLRYYRWLSPRGVKDINDYVVHKGTLLLYKSGTTDGGILGNVFIADNQLDGCCLSDHVIRVVFKDLKKAYWTYAFLKSKGGKRILIRLATGTMIPFITPEKLSDIPIPNPDDHYDKIIQDIEEYIDKSSKAKVAENKAITRVEDEIEKWNKAN
jgi:type I restriction enzyme S subunit